MSCGLSFLMMTSCSEVTRAFISQIAVFDTVTVSATHRLFKNEMMIIEMGS
jgi:hypothetical protein